MTSIKTIFDHMLIIEIYMMTLRKLCFSVEQIVAPAKATAYCFFLTGINNMVHVSNINEENDISQVLFRHA